MQGKGSTSGSARPEPWGQTTVRCPQRVLDQLQEIAAENDRKLAQEIRRALARYVTAERPALAGGE